MEGAGAVAVTRAIDILGQNRPATRRRPADGRTGEFRTPDRALELVAFPLADLVAPTDPSVLFEEVWPRERHETLCRITNVTIALVALLVLAPLFLLIALAVTLTSRGSVFYSQVRVGVDRRHRSASVDERRVYDLGGRPFTMHKFRTMCENAEPDGRAVWAARCDPRVTLIGHALRRSRLDELPQLVNVLRGEMNIVGPRPERPALFADLRADIPGYRLRQRVKPGITGWAQINQCYDVCVDDVRRKVEYDLEYLRRQSLMEDFRIMTMTVPVMLFGRKGW
jgi:lipopolysaccharide/colanic/teichoic acid biosynthesis glycosyltransferase